MSAELKGISDYKHAHLHFIQVHSSVRFTSENLYGSLICVHMIQFAITSHLL